MHECAHRTILRARKSVHTNIKFAEPCGAQQTEFFCHSGPFFALYPPIDPENQNFEKIKKISEYIIILQLCTVNNSHMMYGS